MPAMFTGAKGLLAEALLPTTKIQVGELRSVTITFTPARTARFTAMIARTPVGHRIAEVDGSRPIVRRICSSSKELVRWGKCAHKTSIPWAECEALAGGDGANAGIMNYQLDLEPLLFMTGWFPSRNAIGGC